MAVLFGIATLLAIVGFISHAAHAMDISKILHGVTQAAITEVSDQLGDERSADAEGEETIEAIAPKDAFVVTFERHGWIQQIDRNALLEALEPDTTMWVHATAGRYAITGTPWCRLAPTPSDPEVLTRRVREAIAIGQTRTAQDDATYGVRQLADVALKALSPGINDPTTAQDAMFHLVALVRELLVRPVPARRLSGSHGREVLMPESFTHAEVIDLLEILRLLATSIDPIASREAVEALRTQADLVVEVSEMADIPEFDHERVRSAHRHRFESATSG